MKEKALVSACLLGMACRYDGKIQKVDLTEILKEKYEIIPICPEILGGLPTPRIPCEIKNGRVIDKTGEDKTDAFEKGASEVLKLSKKLDCHIAFLKERSPSCGKGKIYDGEFNKTLVDGNGILASLLLENGFKVYTENEALNEEY